jgi:hypothetical protein
MDRFVPRRRRAGLLLALAMTMMLWPVGGGRAMPPNLSDEPAGDPGDGVLRPSDSSSFPSISTGGSTATATAGAESEADRIPVTYLLVPCLAPPGQPWPLTFRLVRLVPGDSSGFGAARPAPFAGRWHRAP